MRTLRIRDALERFRPAGAPGTASAAGVPVDRGADRIAELSPVFEMLEDVEQQVGELLAQAERDAVAVRARAAERAESVVDAARRQVDAERAAGAARIEQGQLAGRRDVLAAGGREAAQVRRRSAERLPAAVAQVGARIAGLLEPLDRPVGAP